MYETPVAREMRLAEEREAERASRGVFTREAISTMYEAGDITFDELLTAVNNGKVYDEPLPPRNPDATWDEIEERVQVNPFDLIGLDPVQDKKLRLAWSGYFDDGDPANGNPPRFDLPIPNYDD